MIAPRNLDAALASPFGKIGLVVESRVSCCLELSKSFPGAPPMDPLVVKSTQFFFCSFIMSIDELLEGPISCVDL